jgi:hypothetical protein
MIFIFMSMEEVFVLCFDFYLYRRIKIPSVLHLDRCARMRCHVVARNIAISALPSILNLCVFDRSVYLILFFTI